VWLLDLPESVQARVLLGHQGLPLGHPDEVPLLALDQVLGGAFTSRLVSRIRSEEGLAYDVYSESSFPSGYPGAIRVGFQTRSSACAHATATALEAARELRLEEVSPAELGRAREALLALLRDRFGSAVSAVVAMAEDELGGRPASYWSTYRDRVAALTAADLRAAAERHLDPERMRVLVIGDRDAVGQGDPAYPERLADLGLGPVRPLPERDPLTLEPTADDRN
jgi:zinc protease